MNEEAARRNQVDQLVKRFKATGIVDPAEQVWQPTPTAGDRAREVSADILSGAQEEAAAADKTAEQFWNR